jgi:hypothetical protein
MQLKKNHATALLMTSFFALMGCGVDESAAVVSAQQSDSLQTSLRSRIARGDHTATYQIPSDAPQEDRQLLNVSLLLQEAITRGDVITNPHGDSGKDPYVFVSAEKREHFLRLLDHAGITVSIAIPTLAEYNERSPGSDGSRTKSGGPGASTSCGTGCEYQTVGYCEGGLLDGQIYNLGAKYGAYTYAFNYIAGSMVPFSAELSLPYTSSAVGDYNYDYNSPRELYIETYSNLSSANRSKHRCCYWFWGSPSWTIQCSQYFYNQL